MTASISIDELLSPPRITAAWEKVRSNKGSAGEDNITINEISGDFPRIWAGVEKSVREGTYRPAPLRPVKIPKPSGGTRLLAIPSVIDRVLQQSLAIGMGNRWESRFPVSSYAYRPGTGAGAAVDGVLRGAGGYPAPWALHLDIRDFFDNIPEHIITSVLRDTPCDSAVTETAVRSLLAPIAGPAGPRARTLGIPQGSPLSPVMSNAVLLPFDKAFEPGDARLFRYADDMLFLCQDEKNAREVLELAVQRLSLLGLELNSSKTRVSPLAGAAFLGFGFSFWKGSWWRSIPSETWAACSAHLARMEDSARKPSEMAAFLNQWCGYFLPTSEDRLRHSPQLEGLFIRFRLPSPQPAKGQATVPAGFSYDGRNHGKNPERNSRPFDRSHWALWYMLRRCRVGLTFRRKGLLPVPAGIRLCVCGHNLYFRF